ncbi:MAG: endolytic transglycosylase MltG [Pseudomonadota bacterium]
MAAAGLGLILVALAVVWLWLRLAFAAAGPLAEARVVFIPRGASLNAAARQLAAAGVIDDPRVFRWGARLLGDDRPIQAGEYAFAAARAMAEVLAQMQDGKVVLRRVTVPEGMTSAAVVRLLLAEPALEGPITEMPEEGALLPETYFFSRGETRAAVIARMAAAMRETLARLWRERAEGLPFATPQEAVILASIVEKETALPTERALIAGVFVNRLSRGIRLQSDPTVIYGLTQGRLERPLTVRDLDSDSPYNTYRVRGLPPGAIANPGVASLEAVLQPEKTSALYFVADGSGGHVFADSLDEHNRNVQRWRRIEAERRRDDRDDKGKGG